MLSKQPNPTLPERVSLRRLRLWATEMPDILAVLPRDLDAATRTLFGECRGEPIEGQQGVAWVIKNRVESPHGWGTNVEEVCLSHHQFSCWLQADPNRNKLLALAPEDAEYKALFEVARSVMAGEVDDPTNGADHYEVTGTTAFWAKDKTPSAVIGKHSFYAIGA